MDKTISTKLPEGEGETLEKMAEERGESVSGFVRNLVRMAIEKNGKVDGSGEEKQPVPDPKLEEILTLLWRLVESKPVQNPAQNSDPETAKKIEEVVKLLSGIPSILDTKTQEILNEIGQIPKSEGGGTGVEIDVSGLKTFVGEISKALVEGEKKAKNIGGYLGQAEEKAENILGGMSLKISLILLCIGAGFVAGGYALARYTMPDIPALLKQQAALKESIRVLSFQDPKKLDMSTCDGKPCVRIVPGQSYNIGQDQTFYPIDPIK